MATTSATAPKGAKKQGAGKNKTAGTLKKNPAALF